VAHIHQVTPRQAQCQLVPRWVIVRDIFVYLRM